MWLLCFILMHISCFFFFFFANDITYCLVYMYFRLWKGCLSSKWVVKQQRQLNINNTFGPVCNSLTFANECTVQWRIKKFRKGDNSLEGEHSGQPSKVDDWEQSSKLILQLHEKLPKNSRLPILWSFSIWSKFERWKSSVSGYLMSWI